MNTSIAKESGLCSFCAESGNRREENKEEVENIGKKADDVENVGFCSVCHSWFVKIFLLHLNISWIIRVFKQVYLNPRLHMYKESLQGTVRSEQEGLVSSHIRGYLLNLLFVLYQKQTYRLFLTIHQETGKKCTIIFIYLRLREKSFSRKHFGDGLWLKGSTIKRKCS